MERLLYPLLPHLLDYLHTQLRNFHSLSHIPDGKTSFRTPHTFLTSSTSAVNLMKPQLVTFYNTLQSNPLQGYMYNINVNKYKKLIATL